MGSMTFLLMAMTFAAAPGGGSQPVDSEHVSQRMPDRSHDLAAQISAVPGVAAPTFSHPICQTGWTVAQRYDERRADGVIWRATWISKCIPQPKVKWHKRNRQLTRRV